MGDLTLAGLDPGLTLAGDPGRTQPAKIFVQPVKTHV